MKIYEALGAAPPGTPLAAVEPEEAEEGAPVAPAPSETPQEQAA